MLKRFLQCISTLLVLVLLVNILPMQALADMQLDATDNVSPVTKENVAIVAEITEGRSEFSKEFLLSNGLHMATVYAEPVHYEKDGKWEDIDNTLTLSSGAYKNTAGPWEVSFPQSFGSNQSISVTKDGYTLSFGMPQKLTTGGNGAEVMSTEGLSATQAALVTAQAETTLDLSAEKAAAEHPETVLEHTASRLTYENIHTNTDVVYDLSGNKVKESVVLEAYDASLRGFRYTLNVGEMVPQLQEDRSILFYNAEQSEIVMVMPAPYMVDDALEMNPDVTVSLVGKGSTYILTYTLPQSWLAAEERQWPVVLDPVITPSLSVSNIRDTIVASNHSYSHTLGYLDVGYGATHGVKRSYLKYRNLPTITSADVIVEAVVSMAQLYDRSTTIPVEVHKVMGEWESETITWENKPDYNPNVEDFVISHDARGFLWEITDIVQDWYRTGVNTGMIFKVPDYIENAGVSDFRQFASSDFGPNARPTLSIVFRNNNGIEEYWDYTTLSAGRAGNGYINNYTGNLTWARSDMGFDGNLMPVSIGHYYSANDALNNTFSMGYGWRTNYNQLVYRWDQDGDGVIESGEQYYVWEDGDGTRHYFEENDDGEYKDEDGLELTLEVSGSGTSKTYTITNKNGVANKFDSQGRLTEITNNQATPSNIEVAYSAENPKRISTVRDGASRVYQFSYENDLLTKISFMGSDNTEHTYVTYSYTDGNLTAVTDKDNRQSLFTYDTDHLMTSAEDIDGYKIVFTYNLESGSGYAPRRISSIREYDGTVAGGHITLEYSNNQTKMFDVVNDTTLITQFNTFGNPVAFMDDEGRAQYAKFARNDPEDTAGKSNQLTLSSKMQNTVINLLPDSSFEGDTSWTAIDGLTEFTGSVVSAGGYLGNKALSISGTGMMRSGGFTAKANKAYTFSGYVKVSGNGDSGKLGIGDSMGANAQWSLPVSGTDWTRVEVSYTNNTQSDQTVYALLQGTDVYLDCVQVEEMPTASRYNLVNNGDFASSDGWTETNLVSGTDMITAAPEAFPALSSNAYKITGGYTTDKSVKQTISVSGGEGDSFVFGGWAMGNSASLANYEGEEEKEFGIRCTLHYTDDTTKVETVSFNPDVTQWQLVSGAIAAEKAYTSVTVEAVFESNANTVYFDGLQLFKEEFGVSYTYDPDTGDVISVIDLQKKNTEYEYDEDSNLTKIIQDGKTKMEYTYDDYHNVLTATTKEGYVYNFAYDAYGNNTSVSITEKTENEVKQTISTSATYTSDHNQLATATDALGNVTEYGYNLQTGLLEWVQHPKDTEATQTEYTYDELFRTATASAGLESEYDWSMSVDYAYTDDLLTSIITPYTTYNFTYGDFSLRESVKIGSRTLANYRYDDKNRLERLDYGNGDYVQYTYDSQGRLEVETYEDGATVRYAYDNSGNLATVTDSATGVVTTYYYDLLNRQSGYREKGTNYDHSVTYTYDAENNLSSVTEDINGVTKTYSYTYNEDNQLISETVDGITVEYTYDGFGRLKERVVKNGTTEIYSIEPSYSAGTTANSTSTQVASYNGFTYTYDQNGNILSVSDGTYTTSYQYDSQNQLIREANEAQQKAYAWEYDNAGNIVSRKEYVYVNNRVGTCTANVTYGYSDAQWGDLLTYYDGKIINYDEIGNPRTYDGWTFNWKHGRQLASMTKGSTTWTYTYDADGLRTKRTNGIYGSTYTYVYNGSSLAMMTKGNNKLSFSYDATGTPLAVQYNGTTYYYKTNLQGDVMGIVDSNGTTVVTYAYNAWGMLLACSGTMADTLGTLNPLRYRGYVYDTETGLYYLQSRYYNPEWGRFINADIFYSTGQGFIGNNMFAYCLNDPVVYSDVTGTIAIFDDIACVVIIAVVAIVAVCVVELGADLIESVDISFAKKRQEYDPDPYARPDQKKQNRELKNKNRKKDNYKPKNNRRDGKPAQPKHHTPGRDHRKFSQSKQAKTKLDMLYKQIG